MEDGKSPGYIGQVDKEYCERIFRAKIIQDSTTTTASLMFLRLQRKETVEIYAT